MHEGTRSLDMIGDNRLVSFDLFGYIVRNGSLERAMQLCVKA